MLEIIHKISTCSRIEPRIRLIEYQDLRLMQQAFSEFNATLKSSRERFHQVLGPIG